MFDVGLLSFEVAYQLFRETMKNDITTDIKEQGDKIDCVYREVFFKCMRDLSRLNHDRFVAICTSMMASIVTNCPMLEKNLVLIAGGFLH